MLYFYINYDGMMYLAPSLKSFYSNLADGKQMIKPGVLSSTLLALHEYHKTFYMVHYFSLFTEMISHYILGTVICMKIM